MQLDAILNVRREWILNQVRAQSKEVLMKLMDEKTRKNPPMFTVANLEIQLRGGLYWIIDKESGAVAGKAYAKRSDAESALRQIVKFKA